MSIYSEVFEAFLTKATFPANSAAAARADQDLQRLLSESPGDVEEVSPGKRSLS